jgi:cytochrome c5
LAVFGDVGRKHSKRRAKAFGNFQLRGNMAIIPAILIDSAVMEAYMRMVTKAGFSALALVLALGLAACSGEKEEITLTADQEQAVAERLAPEGEVTLESDVVATAPAIDPSASAEPRTGEEIYNNSCTTCHSTGAAGAPKLGDAAAWAPRLEQGMETLYTHAIAGIRGMPPRGLCMDCSDDEVKVAVDYMLENSK